MSHTSYNLRDNPFAVQTPEDISAQDAFDLFVNVFTDFEKLSIPGHTFIHGPRGSGKSMMFRFMQPDCQCLSRACGTAELPYFGVHIPIKNMQANFTELTRLRGHAAEHVINEHVLTVYIAERLLAALSEAKVVFNEDSLQQSDFQMGIGDFIDRLKVCRWRVEGDNPTPTTLGEMFAEMHNISLSLVGQLNSFLQDLALNKAAIEEYDGPLCGYHDFLLPFFRQLKRRFACFPKGPVFLLIDDADNLNYTQTKVLNSWISTRTHSEISIKVSTQLRYKTYLTHGGQSIDAPHDFSDIEISTVYTTKNRTYSERITQIIEKRLKKAGIDTKASDFFPEDADQLAQIDAIKAKLAEAWQEGDGRGNRQRDDVNRYARPDFIKNLGGARKSTHSYSYSGFDQLVSVSSGIVRCFLEPASQMYSEAKSSQGVDFVTVIPPTIQNEKIREFANKFLYSDLKDDEPEANAPAEVQLVGDLTAFEKLENLIMALGGTFSAILASDRAERRVFSIAFSDKPDKEVQSILKLGVEEGYFHLSTIGNKEGTGRTKLYILNRMLAPCFNLDPTSFAGYLFVTNRSMRHALLNPKSYLRSVEKLGVEGALDGDQMELFQ